MGGRLKYSVPHGLKKGLRPCVRRRGRFHHLLDLGCGTGSAGAALKEMARKQAGVDDSPKMLAVAGSKGTYDHLACG